MKIKLGYRKGAFKGAGNTTLYGPNFVVLPTGSRGLHLGDKVQLVRQTNYEGGVSSLPHTWWQGIFPTKINIYENYNNNY